MKQDTASRLSFHHGGDDGRDHLPDPLDLREKRDATLNLDIDPKTHPAWTGGNQALLDRGGRVSRFNSKYGGFMKK